VAPSAEYLRGHDRVAVDVTALRRLWQHSPVLDLVVLTCVPVLYAVLRGSLLWLRFVNCYNKDYYYYYHYQIDSSTLHCRSRDFFRHSAKAGKVRIKVKTSIAVSELHHIPHGKSHAMWDHTVLYLPPGSGDFPAVQPKLVLDSATPEGCKAELH